MAISPATDAMTVDAPAASAAPVAVSLAEFCRIAGNKVGRNKCSIVLEDSPTTSLIMLDDPEGASAGKYDKFLPKQEGERTKKVKADGEAKAKKAPSMTWSKAERDRALKALQSVGASDLARLASLLGRSLEQIRPFVEELLGRLLEAGGAPGSAASKELSEQVLTRAFWGLPEEATCHEAPVPKMEASKMEVDDAPTSDAPADAPKPGASADAPDDDAPPPPSTSLLPADAKFDETLRKNAPGTLIRLAWMKALGELSKQDTTAAAAVAPDAATSDAAATATGSVATGSVAACASVDLELQPAVTTLKLPEKVAKELGVGTLAGGSKGGTLPARWWASDQDRALLEHTASMGLALTDAIWGDLTATAVFAPPGSALPSAPAAPIESDAPLTEKAADDDAPAAEAPAEAEAPTTTTTTPPAAPPAAAAPPAGSISVKAAIARRDALLRRVVTVMYGKPGPSAALKRSRFFGNAPSTTKPAAPLHKASTPGASAGAATADELAAKKADEAERAPKAAKRPPAASVGRVESWESTSTSPVDDPGLGADADEPNDDGAPRPPLSAVPPAMRQRLMAAESLAVHSLHSPSAVGVTAPSGESPAGHTHAETPVTQQLAEGKMKAAAPPSNEPAAKKAKAGKALVAAEGASSETKGMDKDKSAFGKGAMQSAGLVSDPKQAGLMGFFKKAPAAAATAK